MAIITRWRSPPDSSNEYSSTRAPAAARRPWRAVRSPAPAPPRLIEAHVQPDRLDDLVADGVVLAERGHRLLEHKPDLAAADGAHLRPVGQRRPDRTEPSAGRSRISPAHDAAGPSRRCPGWSARRRSCRSRFRRRCRASGPRTRRNRRRRPRAPCLLGPTKYVCRSRTDRMRLSHTDPPRRAGRRRGS